jgi:hypothetical protein
MRKKIVRRSKIEFAALLSIIVLPSAFLVIQNHNIQVAYRQWIDNESLKGLMWVGANLNGSTKPIILAISGNEGMLSGAIDYWRNIITLIVPNSLVYVGKLDNLLLLREPQFENARLQNYAESYWQHLEAQVGSPQNLTAFTIVIIRGFYQPITSLELDARLAQVHDGVYVVKNYTATNRLILFGNVDYTSTKGLWYSIARNWSSYGMVLEIYGNVTVDLFVAYTFYLYESGNYTIRMVAFDDRTVFVPVSVLIDNDQIILIKYSGAEIPKTYNSTEMSFANGTHTIRVSPALNGWLFFNLDYIEIDKIPS